MNLAEERDLADELYRLEIQKCVKAGVMRDNRYEIVNKTRVNHPIVPKKFYERWPEIFEKVVSIEKVKAEAALVADLGLKKTVAKARLDEVCDDVPSGEPQWELEVKKIKEGA